MQHRVPNERLTGGFSFFVVLQCASSVILWDTHKSLFKPSPHSVTKCLLVLKMPSCSFIPFLLFHVCIWVCSLSIHPESHVCPGDTGASYSFGADLSLTLAHLVSSDAILGTPSAHCSARAPMLSTWMSLGYGVTEIHCLLPTPREHQACLEKQLSLQGSLQLRNYCSHPSSL